jgi:hypothetical protein
MTVSWHVRTCALAVMAGLDPAIHVRTDTQSGQKKGVDGRDTPGHDDLEPPATMRAWAGIC